MTIPICFSVLLRILIQIFVVIFTVKSLMCKQAFLRTDPRPYKSIPDATPAISLERVETNTRDKEQILKDHYFRG